MAETLAGEALALPDSHTNGGVEDDRISTLPYDVLCHILSLLPTKFAARTSVLSTMWKHIFIASSVLDFDDSLADVITNDSHLKFFAFVVNVLYHRNYLPVDKFRLNCTRFYYEWRFIYSCIYYAITCHVREIDVNVILTGSVTLPPNLFFAVSLTTLKLSGKFVVHVPGIANLPKLKTMHLEHVEFHDDDSAERLFSNCPVLEELRIVACGMGNIESLNISVLSLKILVFGCLEGGYEIMLDGPNLEYVFFSATLKIWGYEGDCLASLANACIDLYHHETPIDDFSLSGLLYIICNTRQLSLCWDSMEALYRSDQELPIFRNLTELQLLPNHSVGWNMLPSLLVSCPCLEELYICAAETDGRDDTNAKYYALPEDVPVCLSLHLKEISIALFYIGKEECELVEYFLKNASLLKKVLVVSFSCSAREIEMKNRLLSFPRQSEACKLEFELHQKFLRKTL